MKNLLLTLSMGLSVVAYSNAAEIPVDSRANGHNQFSQSTNQADQSVDPVVYEEGELERLLAPIALYPDTLLSHVLIATTYPIEVIEAYRFREKNSALSSQQILDKAEEKDWDPSVKALLPFKNVLKKLHDDLSWTQQLGNAFLNSEQQMMGSIQSLRQQAEKAGHLSSMDNAEVIYEKEKIIIEPIQKEVIYVPYYDTRIVYGDWPWHYYPPIHWHFASHRYSRYYPYHWRTGVFISTAFYFSAIHWHNRYIAVDYAFRDHHRGHYHPRYSHYKGKRHAVIKSGYSKQWRHNPHHRKGVIYKSHGKKVRHYAGYSKKGAVHHLNKKRIVNKTSHNKYKKHVATSHKKYDKSRKYVANGMVKKHQAIKKHNKHSQTVTQVKRTRTSDINKNNRAVRTKNEQRRTFSSAKVNREKRTFGQQKNYRSNQGVKTQSRKVVKSQQRNNARKQSYVSNKQAVNRTQKRQVSNSRNQGVNKTYRSQRVVKQSRSQKSYASGRSKRSNKEFRAREK